MTQQVELARLAAELGLGGAGPGDDEPDVALAADGVGQRLERQVEALLVHQPADEQHQPVMRVGEPGPERVEIIDRRAPDPAGRYRWGWP